LESFTFSEPTGCAANGTAIAKRLVMHRNLLALAACALLLGPHLTFATADQPTAAATQCPRYASLMQSAAQALRRGDRTTALERLREARAALDACSRSGSPPGAGLAGRAPERSYGPST